ncbi:MAG: hypothetical protein HQK65_19650 [Desulfamplus sp.]|nr:hypothetical protein [Desulfamplus sp.]
MNAMTGRDYREKGKERAKKLRDKMKAMGYEQKTHYFSNAFLSEIDRLSASMTKTEAVEHVFQGYDKSVTRTNEIIPKTPAVIDSTEIIEKGSGFIERLEAPETQAIVEPLDAVTPEILFDDETETPKIKTIIEKDVDLFSCDEIKRPAPDDMPSVESHEYRVWLVDRITERKVDGLSFPAIEKEFNSKGIVNLSGKPWGKRTIAVFYNRNK